MTTTHIKSPPLRHDRVTAFHCGTAHLSMHDDDGVTLITFSGDIDAANVDELIRYSRLLLPDQGALIVDLTHVDFIAVDGLHLLFAVHYECGAVGTTWAMVAGYAASRLLRVGDREKVLPAVGSATEALVRFTSPPSRSSLELVGLGTLQ